MFTYLFRHSDGTEQRLSTEPQDTPPDLDAYPWVALHVHQCPTCPLTPDERAVCPPAADLIPVVEAFADITSTEQVEVEVIGPHRTYLHRCDVQTGLRALMGLLMARSACPRMAPLRGMAAMHLPFASRVETAYRVAGAYMLRQFFAHKDNQPVDFELDGLRTFYAELQSINRAFAHRLRGASRQDASVNAIAALSSLSNLVTFSLDDGLEELRAIIEGADVTEED
ncbi:MAG: hypothetical protein AAFV53_09865 [Myxococcota bacterium]